MVSKQALRRRILDRLRRQSPAQRAARSRAIGRRLRRLKLYRQAKVILCYVAVDGEVDTWPLLRRIVSDGKRLAVPVVLRRGHRLIAAEIRDPDRDLSMRGPFGIPQPLGWRRRQISPERIDLVIVPGVAFDRQGKRLGRGGGYFDRFLAAVPPAVPRIGLAFRFQHVRALPFEPHDQPVHRVLTD